MLTFAGIQTSVVEQKLQAAEAALSDAEPHPTTQNRIGHIAALRAMLTIPQHQIDTVIAQSRRALTLLHPDNLPVRTAALWTLGWGYQLQGDRDAASRAYTDAIAISVVSGNIMITIAATTCLGQVQESENQLYLAAQSYRHGLQVAGEPPLAAACEASLGLARVLYQWNDLQAAEQHARQSAQLASQLENVDTPAACGMLLARLRLARGDVPGALAVLDEAAAFVHQHNFAHRIPEVAAKHVGMLLRKGELAAAAQLAGSHDLPISRARVRLAQGDTTATLAMLAPLRQQAEAKGWADERLMLMMVEALALHAHGDKDKAMRVLGDVLTLAQPGGFIRLFVDEGLAMAQLLSEAAARGMMPDYVDKLLAAFEAEQHWSYPSASALGATNTTTTVSAGRSSLVVGQFEKSAGESTVMTARSSQPPNEELSERELEVLQLVAQGLSNREIGERLFLALDTVKGHNRRIYAKLAVQRRTEAVARARELDLL
jgi:LuxR family maltose regulon positive regulatory protein